MGSESFEVNAEKRVGEEQLTQDVINARDVDELLKSSPRGFKVLMDFFKKRVQFLKDSMVETRDLPREPMARLVELEVRARVCGEVEQMLEFAPRIIANGEAVLKQVRLDEALKGLEKQRGGKGGEGDSFTQR